MCVIDVIGLYSYVAYIYGKFWHLPTITQQNAMVLVDYFILLSVYPEPVSGLTSSTSESSAILHWSLQSSGSSARLGVEVEVERDGEVVNRVIVRSAETSVTLTSLQPLTFYTFTVYAVSQVGKSTPISVHDTTLSLSKLQVGSYACVSIT